MFTKALYTKNGDVVTLTEAEAKGVMTALQTGEKWVVVQGEMFSADTIARVGNHEMTAEINRTEHADLERRLVLSGQSDLVDARRLLKKNMAINSVLEARAGSVALEIETIDALHYFDEDGIKHYS